MILSIGEVGKGLPAAPEIPSQSQKAKGAGARIDGRGNSEAENKGNGYIGLLP